MDTLEKVLERIKEVENDPSFSIRKSDSSSNKKTLKIMKKCYNLLTSRKFDKDIKDVDDSLNDLFIEGFDEEQIWQQLELRINSFSSCIPHIAKLHLEEKLAFPFLKDKITQPIAKKDEDNDLEKSDVALEEHDETSGDDSDSGSEDEVSGMDLETSVSISPQNKKCVQAKKKKRGPKSVVDDDFFNLNEMEDFLDKMEKESLSGDDIDYFEDIPSDPESDTKDAKYDDFFRSPDSDFEGDEENSEVSEDDDEGENEDSKDSSKNEKKVRFSINNDSESEHEENSKKEKSTFEIRDSKLREKISKLEESNLSEKPWAYKGEVDASNRPVNSLLEEVLDVDLTVRPPPVITEKVTHTLEQIIINRIKDSVYDDVERKIKPVHVPHELKKELVLNQEKSKYSLAEVYEQEFLKRQPTSENTEESNKLTPEKEKILKKMKSVFHKLDTLSNFHYTPKPVSADLEIVSNMPAITIEEVTPVGMSEASLLAPQEIGDQAKKKLLGKDERTKTDKKRERRKKKAFLSHKFKKTNKPNQLSNALKSRNVSLAQPTTDSTLKSSTTFFKKLQEDNEIGVKVKKKFKKQK